jgi:hypothetical protein
MLVMLSELMTDTDSKVSLDTAVAFERLLRQAYTLMLAQPKETFNNMVR